MRALDASAIRYLIVGVGNTLFGLLIIYLAKWLLGLGDVSANALGYACGLALSFVLNKRWSFRHHGPVWPALIRFLLVIGTAYTANLLVVLTCIHTLNIDSYLAQAIGIVPYTVIGYLGSRLFAFPETRRASEVGS